MDLFDDDPQASPGDNTPEFTVSELAGTVRKIIETELSWIRIRGEVGRVVLARSGHLYFDLKDEKSVLQCMTWKGQRASLSIMPEEGMEVVAEGKMTASGLQSKFGLNVQRLEIAGEGALLAMLEKRKKALEAEGLFAPERKKPLPYLPEIIGVITSPQGAVIRDILHRLRDRFPRKVLLWPVAVQGKQCAPDVANAIHGFNALTPGGALPRPDLLIVARGGGSIEDLWGFNEEVVARAAANSAIPLISAVGHETDTTLIDFVSDKRAPTPTAAAELAVPVRLDLLAWVEQQDARLTRAAGQGIERRRQRLADLARVLPKPDALLNDPRQRLDRAEAGLARALERMVERKKADLSTLSGGLRPAALNARIAAERARLADRAERLAPGLQRRLQTGRDQLEQRASRLRPGPLRDRVTRLQTELDRTAPRIGTAVSSKITKLSDRLDALDRMRLSLGYEATLARGYAVVHDTDGAVVTKAGEAKDKALEIEFQDGRVPVGPEGTKPTDPGVTFRPKKPEQGSLF
ncbi:MAG: exodeoxyribonuclease VII large subunit [Pseudomonadota bacterium]